MTLKPVTVAVMDASVPDARASVEMCPMDTMGTIWSEYSKSCVLSVGIDQPDPPSRPLDAQENRRGGREDRAELGPEDRLAVLIAVARTVRDETVVLGDGAVLVRAAAVAGVRSVFNVARDGLRLASEAVGATRAHRAVLHGRRRSCEGWVETRGTEIVVRSVVVCGHGANLLEQDERGELCLRVGPLRGAKMKERLDGLNMIGKRSRHSPPFGC